MEEKNNPPYKWEQDIPIQTINTGQYNIVTILPGVYQVYQYGICCF